MKKQLLLILAALMLSLGATAQMVLQFDTNLSEGTTITLPLKEMSGTVTVDWGDGTATESFTTADNYNHTYANDGIYTVSITGSLTGFGNYLAGYENADKLTAVSSWGNLPLTSLAGAFYGAINLSTVPSSVPSTVTNMSGMFYGARIFNQDISTWDVSNVTDMSNMFIDARIFNQDIGAWDVSSVTNMSHMFRAAGYDSVAFNQDISGWDVSNVTNMSSMFYGARYFNQDISLWNVSQVTEMRYMFENAIMFNQDISYWDVSQVISMQSMFENAAVFDQDLGAWNVTKVTNFTDMFNGANLSVDNYNNLLIGWAGKAVRTGRNFNAGNSMYSAIASSAKNTLTNTYGWTITDGGLIDDDAMVLIFDTNLSAGTTIALPLQGAVDVTVSWGDSNIDNFNTAGNKTHTYDADGVYTVIITGSLTQFGSSSGYDSNKLTRVTNWGNLGLTSLSGAFIFASNLTNVPNSLPSGITNTSYMFNDCYKFNANISNWDVSSVTDMYAMFENATSFNQDISDWDVSSVTDMSVMFQDAISFNQDISYWNVSSVTDMSGMFWNATSFDQNISAWNISNVTTMNGMFGGVTLSTANYDDILITWADEIPYYGVQPFVPFDGGNSKYSISAVNARESLVQHRWAITDGGIEIPENAMVLEFNTNLSEGNTITLPLQGSLSTVSVYWGDNSANTYTTAGNYDHTYANAGEYTVYIAGYLSQFGNANSGYTNADKLVGVADFGNLGTSSFHGAFKGATNLTQVPSSLPSTVTNTASMFSGASAFNQDIGGWDVSNVTNMNSMFYEASAFNQDIGNWDVSNVTDMSGMFGYASTFNQDISLWNVGNVTDMLGMFDNATSFNQNIGEWDVGSVTDMFYMFYGATSFDQDLSNWNVSSVVDMEGMFDEITLSTANYDALLIGWAGQTVQNGVTFSGGNSTYSPGAAADARAKLIDTYSWTITDGGESTASAVNSTLAETMGVYPNPFQNTINISNASNAKRVVITNVVGKVVMVVDLNQVSNEVIETNVPSGMYLVTIFANDGSRVVRKMIRE